MVSPVPTKHQTKKQHALVLLQQDRIGEARRLLRQVCRTSNRDTQSWHLLGMAEARLTDIPEAVKCFRHLLTLDSTCADTHYYLGSALEAVDDLEGALASYREAIQLQPTHVKAHCNLGNILLRRGAVEEAETAYREALRVRPDDPDALGNLGVALKEQSKLESALEYFNAALRSRPDDPGTYANIGNTYHRLGQFAVAESAYRRAIDLNPRQVEAYSGYCGMLVKMQRSEEALRYARLARVRIPDDPAVIASEATIHDKLGQFEEAHALLRPIMATGTPDVDVAVTFAQICGRFRECKDAIALLEALVRGGRLAAKNQMRCHFMLGKLYDADHQFDLAFHHYAQGNSLKPYRFEPAEYAAEVDQTIKIYSPGFLKTAPHATNPTELPVFIVGMPRSGTTLVEQIVASHPAVYGADELMDMPLLAASVRAATGGGMPYPKCMRAFTRGLADHLAERYLQRLRGLSSEARRITDKLPGNFKHLGFIQLLFPGARIIHCVRDPIDTCLSCYFQDFEGYHPYAYDLSNLGRYYREYERLMRHWKAVLNIPIMEVRYEEVVADQEAATRRLLEFLGLDWDARCLQFYESGRIVKTASYDQVRRPIYRKSVARWKHYATHLGPLRQALQGHASGSASSRIDTD